VKSEVSDFPHESTTGWAWVWLTPLNTMRPFFKINATLLRLVVVFFCPSAPLPGFDPRIGSRQFFATFSFYQASLFGKERKT
jgi:hypothetical protein